MTFPEITGSPSESPIVVPCKQPPISSLLLFTKSLKYEMGPFQNKIDVNKPYFINSNESKKSNIPLKTLELKKICMHQAIKKA